MDEPVLPVDVASGSYCGNADSILLRKSTVEGASLFVGDTVLSQAPGSSVVAGVRTYSGAEGKPIAEKSAKTGTAGTTLTWVFSNLEGTVDVRTLANATGMTTRILRDPYGAPIGGSNGVWSNGTGYMNTPVTASTGLTAVGARTYDPVLGKFRSVDPVIDTSLPQQNTGYTYSGNNPTTYIDPTGLRLTIGCEPRCGKGAATIVQKLTPRNQADRANTKVYAEQIKLDAKRQAWGDKIFGEQSDIQRHGIFNTYNLDPYFIPPVLRRPGPSGPPQQPLIEIIAPIRGTIDFGVLVCAGGCANLSISNDLSGSFSLGWGPKAGISGSIGASTETNSGAFMGGSCTAVAGLVGGYIQGGFQENGPAYIGGGLAVGASAGCSFDVGWSW